MGVVPDPYALLQAFVGVPSSYRASVLAPLENVDHHTLKTSLTPQYDDSTGIGIKDMDIKVISKISTGKSDDGKKQFTRVNNVVLKPQGTLEEMEKGMGGKKWKQFVVELKGAKGVPVPHDARAEDVIQRSVRCILFHESPANTREEHFVANGYKSPAFQHASMEDCWTFPSVKHVDGDNKFVVRTDLETGGRDENLYLLVELTLTLRSLKESMLGGKKKRKIERYSSTGDSDSDSDSDSDPPPES
jgi:hypothetical protein